MARVTTVKSAQQRFKTVPVLDEQGQPKKVQVFRKNGEPKLTKKGAEIWRKVTVEDKTQPLPNHTCGKCGKEIKVGDPYKWIQPKSGPYGGSKRYRCISCPSWRPSETTGSAALGALYGAQEAAEDALANWDRETVEDLQEIANECAAGVREAAEVYKESAQNMEDGFGHSTYQSDELNEKADNLESAADELENVDLDDWNEDAAKDEALAESVWDEEAHGAYDWDEDSLDLQDEVDTKRADWADEQESKVSDLINDIYV